jgi:hypothetical protein
LDSEEQPPLAATELLQSVERIHSIARPGDRFIDTSGLRGGNSFGAPVKKAGLKHLGRESRMVLINGARDRGFAAT